MTDSQRAELVAIMRYTLSPKQTNTGAKMTALNEIGTTWEPCQTRRAMSKMDDDRRENFAQYASTMRRMKRGIFQMWGSHNQAWANYFAERHNVIY